MHILGYRHYSLHKNPKRVWDFHRLNDLCASRESVFVWAAGIFSLRRTGFYLNSCTCNKMCQYLPPTPIKWIKSNNSFQVMIACLRKFQVMIACLRKFQVMIACLRKFQVMMLACLRKFAFHTSLKILLLLKQLKIAVAMNLLCPRVLEVLRGFIGVPKSPRTGSHFFITLIITYWVTRA